MAELLEKLTEREKAKFVAEKEAAGRVRAAEAEVTAATEALLELKRRQEQEIRVLKAQNEKRIRDASHAARLNVDKAQKDCAMAEALADTTEKRQRRSEAHATNLEQKVAELQAMIARREHEAAAELLETERMMASRYERVASQADDRIRSMAEHAREVCTAASVSLEIASDELQDQMARASIRAEGRVRFKELKDLAKSWDRFDITKESYTELKDNLIDLWRAQANSARNSCNMYPETVRSMLSPSPDSAKSPFGRAGQNMLAEVTPESARRHSAR